MPLIWGLLKWSFANLSSSTTRVCGVCSQMKETFQLMEYLGLLT
uniref:Uncharacterized protein n=1 Tax=Utricularia reniformis TaxID=192314 RepID=A0A1Y0B4C5_9LAMI|nr:hypothetical protein AEK19_MT2096 [Utricularia reniformis]ART32250.1 hypothetical protein AEK19_MT2096 [Utricularia reniformis]